jgi:arsenite oxidase small subunit
MSRFSRRDFLKTSGAGAAVTASAAWSVPAGAQNAAADAGAATLNYPEKALAKAAELTVNQPLAFTYPDAASPCALLKMGQPVSGGAGPDSDIVAYSTLCTHMGCPVNYDAAARTFKCPCHFSIFDPEKSGQQVCGQATEALPHIELAYNDSDGSIRAVGIQGHLYGRLSNIL